MVSGWLIMQPSDIDSRGFEVCSPHRMCRAAFWFVFCRCWFGFKTKLTQYSPQPIWRAQGNVASKSIHPHCIGICQSPGFFQDARQQVCWMGAGDWNGVLSSPDCLLLQTAKVSPEVTVRGWEGTLSGWEGWLRGYNTTYVMDPKLKCL